MGHRREEQYRRLQHLLRGMLAVNLILVGIVVMLGLKTVSLNREIKQLNEQIENVGPSFGVDSDHETDEADRSEEGTSESDETERSSEQEDLSTENTTEESLEAGVRNYIVCLDAGHGGPGGKGAISTLDGRIESHDTLKLTLAVQKALEAYDDITVVMTRTGDEYVDNGVRAQIANDADADLFVSFHRNSNTSGDKGGIEGWIHSSNPDDSRAAGELILAAMEKVGVTYNYGVKSGTWDEPDVNYKIIRLAEMPAVLLEVGYLNYARDNELYDRYYESYAVATAEAIYAWLKDWVNR